MSLDDFVTGLFFTTDGSILKTFPWFSELNDYGSFWDLSGPEKSKDNLGFFSTMGTRPKCGVKDAHKQNL